MAEDFLRSLIPAATYELAAADLDAALKSYVRVGLDAVWIDLDSPGGEIAGRPGIMTRMVHTARRRARANRYSRSPAWRFRARRERLVP